MHFGATLRLLRLDSGLGLRDLARRLSVSGAYLSRVENGLDAPPTPARIEAMARELGIPATLLIDLAYRVSPLVVDYVQQVPAAGTLFLEIAHRRLDERQVAELRELLNQRFPLAGAAPAVPWAGLSDLLAPDRIVLGFTCSDIEDVLDVAAGRLAKATGQAGPAIADALKKREREVASALGNGIAVPSAYTSGADSAAVLVTLATPLDYETPDRKPLRAVVVLAGPRSSTDRRLRLAHLARLTARGLADELALARSPAEVLSRLAQLEALR